MSKSPQDIQLEQDVAYQHREWHVERIGWVLMCLVIIAAMLGLFGGAGFLLQASVPLGQGDSAQLEYPRFGRFQSPVDLVFRLNGAEDAVSTDIWVSEEYLGHFQIEQVSLAPDAVETKQGRAVYTFRGRPQEVSFHLKTADIGLVNGQAGIADTSGRAFRQFIYP